MSQLVPSGSMVQAMYRIAALTLAVVTTSMARLRTASRPARSSGRVSLSTAATRHPDRDHQRAATPVAGDHQAEGRDQDQSGQQDRPLPAEDLARELPQRHWAA